MAALICILVYQTHMWSCQNSFISVADPQNNCQFFNTDHILSFSLITFVISVLLLCYLYEQCIYLSGIATYIDFSFK